MAAAAPAAFPVAGGRPTTAAAFPGLFHAQHSQPSSTSSSPLQQPIREPPSSPSPLMKANQGSAFSPVEPRSADGEEKARSEKGDAEEKIPKEEEKEVEGESQEKALVEVENGRDGDENKEAEDHNKPREEDQAKNSEGDDAHKEEEELKLQPSEGNDSLTSVPAKPVIVFVKAPRLRCG